MEVRAVSYPRLYIGQKPATPLARRTLRLRALDLAARFKQTLASEPTYALLHFLPSNSTEHDLVELLLLRPNAVLVGLFKDSNGPLDILPNGEWIVRDAARQIRGPYGETPLEQIKRSRDVVLRQLQRYNRELPDILPEDARFARTIGALIVAPKLHPESRVTLDVVDHRQQIKVLGFDELPGLAAMAQTGVQLSEEAMQVIVAEVFGGRRWYDGEQLLFELALAPFQLQVLAETGRPERALSLIEGANVVGRREAPLHHEYRLTLSGDDLMSNDHAIINCTADGRVILRDTSTNGTWVEAPGAAEERLHHVEQVLAPGSMIRMGVTRMWLEQIADRVVETGELLP